jgi:hypothetical protein
MLRPLARIASFAILLGFASLPGVCDELASVTARLLGRVDSRHAAVGEPFFVKTISAWKLGRCTIPMGTTLEGRVDKVVPRTRGARYEELALRFLLRPCPTDDTQEIVPLLVAIHRPARDLNDDMLARQKLMTAFASVAGAHSPSGGPAAGPRAGVVGGVSAGFSPMPSTDSFRAGEVRGYPSVKLTLPHVTSDPTVLTGSGELLFDPDARFVLVIRTEPASTGENVAVASAGAESPAPSAPSADRHAVSPPPPPPPVLVEDCVAGGCVTAAAATGIAEHKAGLEVPLRSLSYRPRLERVVQGGLENQSAIVFLGEDQLFATFNAHTLVPRTSAEAMRSVTPRQIRGVLLSTRTGQRLRVVDWLVPDSGAYLWPLDRNRVLVHAGNALVIYGPDLKEEARWPIPGSLVFLTLSPSRQSILVAVQHNTYDAATFRRLAEFIGSSDKVQEDTDLIALDAQLQQTASRPLTGTPAPLPLLDTGMISATNESGTLWKIELDEWSGHHKQLARLTSGCRPTVRTLPANLIFLSGCQPDSASKWYRVLRANGKTLLRGTATNAAIPEYATASLSGDSFAIGVELANCPVDWETGMSISNLESMAVSVYHASSGRRVYSTKLPSHSIDQSILALSPAGNWLAILGDDSLRIYPIAPPI